jgi:hypothetical protein
VRHLRWMGFTLLGILPAFPLQAQSPSLGVEAGLGYARVFAGGGVSFQAAVDRPMSPASKPMQHAVGLMFWYAQTDIASLPENDSDKRDMLGLGFRYRLGLKECCGIIRPFMAVPLEVLRSSVPEPDGIALELTTHGVPQLPPEPPKQDQSGAAWGWGAGLELGMNASLAENVSAQTGVQGFYQDIYSGVSSHTAWTWHLGLSYGF